MTAPTPPEPAVSLTRVADRPRRLVAALLALAVVVGGLAAAPAGGTRPVPRLHREGRWLVDHLGRVVLLHGVNAVYKLEPYAPPATPAGFTDADAAWLADHGFNSVRLGALFAGVRPQVDHIDAGYLDAIGRVADLLARHHIWTLFDFHQDMFNERFQGEGFPGWAVNQPATGAMPPPTFGFPGNYLTPQVSEAFDSFWLDRDNLIERYAGAWQAVARRFADQPYSMGYDLMNEPWPGSQYPTCATPQGCPVFDTQVLQPTWRRLTTTIRQADPNNLVWYEPEVLFNFGAQTNMGPVADDNVGLSWHDYCLPAAALHAQGFTDLPACPQLHDLVWDHQDTARARMGTTSLVTEFGASDDLADLTQVTARADAHLTGWQYWQYKEWADPTTESQDSGGQGLFRDDADLATLKRDKARILVRTYPQATAGIPTVLSFDPDSGDFSYTYTPRPAAGPTEIFVSPLHYPHGYRIEVIGATVTSPPGAHLVTLRNLPGATEVAVHVRAD